VALGMSQCVLKRTLFWTILSSPTTTKRTAFKKQNETTTHGMNFLPEFEGFE
jgi:hypothetical protein